MRQLSIMVSIDWLSIYQDFEAGSLPVLASALVLHLDNKGELQKEFYKGFLHEGSYSTSLVVRSDGTRLSVAGNPSKFCRLDNVFGVKSVQKAVEIYNKTLVGLGLPEFYCRTWDSTRPFQATRGHSVYTERAIVTRVDLCQNFALGESVNSFMDWVANQSIQGKAGHRYANGATVDFGRGSRYTYCKYYLKAVDLERDKKRIPKGPDRDYLDRLQKWCSDIGMVRFEVSLKSMALKRQGLDNAWNWSAEIMGQVIEKYAAHFRLGRTVKGVGHPFDSIVKDLVDKGVSEAIANRCEVAARAWLAGSDVRVRYSRATLYRLRKPLLMVGIDLMQRCDVKTLLPQVRELTISDVVPPTFYRTA